MTTLSRQEKHGDMGGLSVAPVQGFGPGHGRVLDSVFVCLVHGARVDVPVIESIRNNGGSVR